MITELLLHKIIVDDIKKIRVNILSIALVGGIESLPILPEEVVIDHIPFNAKGWILLKDGRIHFVTETLKQIFIMTKGL